MKKMKFTKLGFMVMIFCMAVGCNANEEGGESAEFECIFTPANMAIKAPVGADIVNNFRKKSKEMSLNIDRFYLVFADGSSAIVEHNYCLVYNFSVHYYPENYNDVNDPKKIASIVNRLFAYNAYNAAGIRSMSFKKPLQGIVESELKVQGYDPEKNLQILLPYDDIKIDRAIELAVGYYPMKDSGGLGGILFNMNIGMPD